MSRKAKKQYDESAVQSLDALTHIRRRSGMYIGRLGDGSNYDDGIYILLKEVFDNSIDEWIMGHGSRIELEVEEKGGVRVRDYGRGIPLGKVVDCVSEINTGAKYNDDVFQFSVGLNGVGTKAVNALSKSFTVKSIRDGRFVEASFVQGKLISEDQGSTKEKNGTLVSFVPDQEIFGSWKYQLSFVRKRLEMYSYLNKGLVIAFNGEKIVSSRGLLDLIEREVREPLYTPLSWSNQEVEFAFTHTGEYGESCFSFVNGQYTADGGTHLAGFREGVLRAINEYGKKSFQSIDLRDGFVGCVLVRVKEPVFESQTKSKLSNTELRSHLVKVVKEALLELLFKETDLAKKLLDRLSFNEKLRKELASVKKEAKERQKKISLKIPKLRDCRHHYSDGSLMGHGSMIFLTEGESASASLVSTRDPLVQAIFSLRGKPLNVFGMKQDQLYKNEEMFNVMSALGIEEGIEGLRYGKVILATDADVDGLHIRNLLMTFFLTYFEALVLHGHLYILQTPLFKVRNKKETRYCYSEEEKATALKDLGEKSAETTRFKGLGEISPSEFKDFIGPKMRLEKVRLSSLSEVKPILTFFMGKNTPERKQFIMDSLVSDF